jgi:bifunctional non-homologous end joining protein LigD
MRDFSRTAEPAGESGDEPTGAPALLYVVQRHRARRLHYDLRLQVDGVLASWAVPKGPTLDPAARRLAVHVEDHPMEYADFEGVIPRGEYGGGDVVVWDRGVWTPVATSDPATAIAAGELHFELDGEKLHGRFLLVRRGRSDAGGQEQWILIHKRDDASQAGWNADDFPQSVKSGRTNDEVAADPDAIWRSDLPAAEAEQRVVRETVAPTEKAVTATKSVTAKKATPTKKSTSTKKSAPSKRGGLRRHRWKRITAAEQRALAALGKSGMWTFDGQELRLTNLDKILFPAGDRGGPFTKRDLIAYYAEVAPVMLPYLADRPLNMHRYPDGVDKAGFWHKEVPKHAAQWLTRWHNDEADPGESEWYFVADRPAALAWLANYGAVELHPWTSRQPDVHKPTWALIDIDPGRRTSFDEVLVLARLYRTALEHLGVVGRPKVTGRRGVQIWVPIEVGPSFDETRRWVEALSRAVGATVPDLVSWKWHTSERDGLARLDYTQNAINRTLVAPYSVRAAAGAPVSVPLEWDELDDPDLRPDRWNLTTVRERLAAKGDPFQTLLSIEQTLPAL